MPGALHQVFAGDVAAGAATAFAAILLARILRQRPGMALWCLQPRVIDSGEVYGPGLARFGLDPARLVFVRARRHRDALWTMEEGLRCRDLAAVLGEAGTVGLTASRRLQLAAESGGVTGLLLHPSDTATGPSAATTCWRIAAAPSLPHDIVAELGEPGPERWSAELVRSRRGTSGAWLMEWCDETGDLALSSPLRDRADRERWAGASA